MKTKNVTEKNMKVCLVGSSGGHLTHLYSKSIIMNWSIDRRFSRGLFLTPALLGYDKDEEGNLVINPEEAQTVKVIYYLYLNGYSLTEIATLLMEYS